MKIPAVDLRALLRFEVLPMEWSFGPFMPACWPTIAWPYFVLIGWATTFALGVLFPTRKPKDQV